MPTLVESDDSREQTISRDPNGHGVTRSYTIFGSDDDAAIRTFAEANIPGFYAGLLVANYKLSPQGCGIWRLSVHYGSRGGGAGGGGGGPGGGGGGTGIGTGEGGGVGGSPAPGELQTVSATLSFQTGSDKQKITHALDDQFNYYGAAVTHYSGAIGIKKGEAGRVKAEGIEVGVPGLFRFTVKRTFGAAAPMSGDYIQLLSNKTWHVNEDEVNIWVSGVHLVFAPGELLFEGSDGSQRSSGVRLDLTNTAGEGDLQLNFARQPNLVDGTIAGITGVNKQGWDYAEVMYEDGEADSTLIPVATQVNISRVYPRTTLMPIFV